MKKIMGLIIVVILCVNSLVSCSDKKEMQKGVYVEEECSIPETAKSLSSSIIALKELDNNDIDMIVVDENKVLHKYLSSDSGKSWKEEKIEIPSIPDGDSIYTYNSIIDNKGNIYLLYSYLPTELDNTLIDDESGKYTVDVTNGVDGYVNNLIKIDTKGKIENIEFDKEFSNYMFSKADDYGNNTSKNILYLTSENGKLYTLDCNTGKIKKILDNKSQDNDFCINNKNIVSDCSGKLRYYDITSMKERGKIKNINKNRDMIIDSNSNDSIYVVNHEGLCEYNLSENKLKNIIKAKNTSFSQAENYVINFLNKSNGDFLVLFMNVDDGYKLINYRYDKNATYKKKKSLTVYSLYKNDTISEMISKYESKNKGIAVKYEYGIKSLGDTSITESDVIKKLNTELMSDKGPDIIFLDGLNSKNYIKKGLLSDISSVKDLDSLTKAIEDDTSGKDILNINDGKELLNLLYYSSKDSWINKDNSINDEKLKSFLKDTKSIYTKIDKQHSSKEISKHNEVLQNYKKSNNEKYYYKFYLENNVDCGDYCNDIQPLYQLNYLESVLDLETLQTINKNFDNYDYAIWNGQSSSYFF